VSESKLSLWESVEKTDPAFTKRVNQRGGYTAITPQYQSRMATEQFGPYGLGWGLKETTFDTSMFEATGMVIHDAIFFYKLDGEEITFPIHNAVKPMMGERCDEDWPKKLETNTISKALSRLGFNADIFMGQFDDMNYVNAVKTEFDIAKADDADEAMAEKVKEFTDWAVKELETYPLIPNKAALKAVLAGHLKKIYRQCPVIGMNPQAAAGRFQKAHDEAVTEIQAKEILNAS